MSREALAQAYRTAEQQQAAQPMDGPARRLACHMLSEFFSQPICGGRPELKLVVDNNRSKTATVSLWQSGRFDARGRNARVAGCPSLLAHFRICGFCATCRNARVAGCPSLLELFGSPNLVSQTGRNTRIAGRPSFVFARCW
jgi:hypothetical protein